MKPPRFRIAWIMVAVAIAALDFWAIRTLLDFSYFSPEVGEALVFGALPIMNVLGVLMLVGRWRPSSRPLLLGFEYFGALALAIYFLLVIFFPGAPGPIHTYVRPLVILMKRTVGRDRPFVFYPILSIGIVLMLGLPQVAFALLGAFLSRKFKVAVTFKVAITRR